MFSSVFAYGQARERLAALKVTAVQEMGFDAERLAAVAAVARRQDTAAVDAAADTGGSESAGGPPVAALRRFHLHPRGRLLR